MTQTQTLQFALLPAGNCQGCGRRTSASATGFCSLACQKTHTDRLIGRSWRAERAARTRREAYEALRRG